MALPEWLKKLRRREIVEVVRGWPETAGDCFLGICKDEVLNQVIGCGQADFDLPYRHLSGEHRALLYAYFNQLGHLEELHEAFRQLFKNGPPIEPLIVLDLGSGPFTGGLALAAVLGNRVPFSFIGLDRSTRMRELGESLARAAEHAGALNCADRQWVADFGSIQWKAALGWRPILVIASYLLASPTFDAHVLVKGVDAVCSRLGRGSVTVLYTNSPHPIPNRSFAAFRIALEDVGFSIVADDLGLITMQRADRLIDRELRYALFQRDARRRLEL